MKHVNRVVAAVLSLAVIVIGVLLIVEVIADRTNHRPAVVHWQQTYRWATRTNWQQGSIRVACGVLIVVGVVLLIAELKRPRVQRIPVGDESDIDAAYTRSGLAAAVRSAVTAVDGVQGATVNVKRRRITVAATTSAADRSVTAALREPISAATARRLAALQLRSHPSVSVRVKPRSS